VGRQNWALEGLDRIIRQPFTAPKASDDAIRDLQDLVSPISAFVRDFCDRGRDKTVRAQDLYAAWRQYCEDNGHRATASSVFGRDLRPVMPTLRHYQPHGQPRQYVGLELKPAADRYSTAYTTHSGVNHVSPVSHVSIGPSETSETGETGEKSLWPVQGESSETGETGETGEKPSWAVYDTEEDLPTTNGQCPVCNRPLAQPSKACPARQYHGEAAA
jgi:putative DNA primase/helicase